MIFLLQNNGVGQVKKKINQKAIFLKEPQQENVYC